MNGRWEGPHLFKEFHGPRTHVYCCGSQQSDAASLVRWTEAYVCVRDGINTHDEWLANLLGDAGHDKKENILAWEGVDIPKKCTRYQKSLTVTMREREGVEEP